MNTMYKPVSYWNYNGSKVAFGAAFDTPKEAEDYGKNCEKLYGDQKYSHVEKVEYSK